MDSPPHCPVVCVGVGVCGVWACCRDHSVWYRRGITSTCHVGTTWLDMTAQQRLRSVSVGPEEQVGGWVRGNWYLLDIVGGGGRRGR